MLTLPTGAKFLMCLNICLAYVLLTVHDLKHASNFLFIFMIPPLTFVICEITSR